MIEGRPRLLVVDDVADAADSLALFLRLHGYDVAVAYDGASALEAARTFGPRVVLLDVAMPGMDGFRLAQRLQEGPGLADTALIAITGHEGEAWGRRAREVGIEHYLVKPVDPAGSRPRADRATRQAGVMVVGEHSIVRDVLGVWLRRQGFVVWLAASGLVALDLYCRRRGEIDVVILDACMPGLDGLRTMAALRAWDPRVPCCFLSDGFGRYTEKQLREAGAAAVLTKPPRPSEIASVVRRLAGVGPPGGWTTAPWINETAFASTGRATGRGAVPPERPSDSPPS